GYWETPFDPEITRRREFFINNETAVRVVMMRTDGNYYTYRDEELGCEVVRIPYQGNASALFILPDKGKLNQVEQALGREALLRWETFARQRRIDLSLPRVSLRTNYDVKELFKGLGITEVFTDQADLSAFTEQHKLKISQAVHEAYLNIHENGTEAAVTTVIDMDPYSLPPIVTFNRPYLVVVVEHLTHAILFLGRVVNPNENCESEWGSLNTPVLA
ncbi:PREDICTED: alpha-1-antiproteinase-like, partial [Gekko japonicus]|uniref:Alpha-1-antiproteinase-like n=1 Tax=Gekko japonicus TaxID=146911 RepID=A0ABM1KLI4_GEKJA